MTHIRSIILNLLVSFVILSSNLGMEWNFSRIYPEKISSIKSGSPSNWVIKIRRDISNGVPYDSPHAVGISTIVWGSVDPNIGYSIKLVRNSQIISQRDFRSSQYGLFTISMDEIIEDGDDIVVSNPGNLKTIHVEPLLYQADPVTKTISGIGPANINSTSYRGNHTFSISLAGIEHQVTTNSAGQFTVSFSDLSYLAGQLGTMLYINQVGDYIYKPVFVGDPLVRGANNDWRADVILGQPGFGQITNNEVVGSHGFNTFGVIVDRSVRPNRVYVYDSGNSRILGWRYLGFALGGPESGQPCTSNSDHPNSVCQILPNRPADIIIGQPDPNTSACNGDSGYQYYPDVPLTDANHLCGMSELTNSVSEGWSGATMDVDNQGNLYATDLSNNRVLKYNSPLTTDATADQVWGQADFRGIHCNRGAGYDNETDAKSLCLTPTPGHSEQQAGVDIDEHGNLWVADNANNRVLRFPFDPITGQAAKTADLVLGQAGFTTTYSGDTFSQMNRPESVRVDSAGNVYVADALNKRVLVFHPPYANGMAASSLLGSGWTFPTGLEFDLTGGIWVSDAEPNRKLVLYENGVKTQEIPGGWFLYGGMGIDADNNLLVAFDSQVQHYRSTDYQLDAVFLQKAPNGFNQTGGHAFLGGVGFEVVNGQLIYSDWSRLLFWNHPLNLSNGQIADGVIGEASLDVRSNGSFYGFGRLRADNKGNLWALKGGNGGETAQILRYQLPLTTNAEPTLTITPPLALVGGGSFDWSWSVYMGGIAYQPSCDCLWLSDSLKNRVFRIRNISTTPEVDIVLGQTSVSGIHCNQGRDSDDGYVSPQFPTQDSLCHPGGLSIDNSGNLFVSDHNLEVAGNKRLLVFDKDTLPDSTSQTIYGIPASYVLGRNNSFTLPNCTWNDPICGPWEPAFDSIGRMVLGFNSYLGPRFPMVYSDPLNNPLPIAALADIHSQPLSARFDPFDNLYVLDHNRSRILIYKSNYSTYSIQGTILRSDGKPLQGIRVSVDSANYHSSAFTGIDGRYKIEGLPPGTYSVVPVDNRYKFSPSNRTAVLPGNTSSNDFIGEIQEQIFLPVVVSH